MIASRPIGSSNDTNIRACRPSSAYRSIHVAHQVSRGCPALTTNQGAFLLTTTLAKLAMIGLAAQAPMLTGKIPSWAVACIVLGALLFLLFWDLDNWMTIGTLLILAGLVPVRRALLADEAV